MNNILGNPPDILFFPERMIVKSPLPALSVQTLFSQEMSCVTFPPGQEVYEVPLPWSYLQVQVIGHQAMSIPFRPGGERDSFQR